VKNGSISTVAKDSNKFDLSNWLGNSDGDRQMLEYTKAGNGMRPSAIVLHDGVAEEIRGEL